MMPPAPPPSAGPPGMANRVLIMRNMGVNHHKCRDRAAIKDRHSDPNKSWGVAEIIMSPRTERSPEQVVEIPMLGVDLFPKLGIHGIRYVLNWDLLLEEGYTKRTVNSQGGLEWFGPGKKDKSLFYSRRISNSIQEVVLDTGRPETPVSRDWLHTAQDLRDEIRSQGRSQSSPHGSNHQGPSRR